MKNRIIIIVLAVLFVNCSKKKEEIKQTEEPSISISKDSTNQISLKGVTIGQIYNGETTLFTTVADIEGVISISLLDDNRAYKIAFMSNKETSSHEVANFKKNVENNYNILLKENTVYKDHFYNYIDNLYYSYIENQIEKDIYSISFSVTDKELSKYKEFNISSDF